VLGSGVAVCFTWLSGILPYGATVAVTCVVGFTATIAIAIPFEHWIERPDRMSDARFNRNHSVTRSPAGSVNDLRSNQLQRQIIALPPAARS
jgi:hypothetical protein